MHIDFKLATVGLALLSFPSIVRAQGSAVPPPAGALPRPERPIPLSPKLADVVSGLSGKTLNIDDVVSVALVTNHSLATASENLYRTQGRTSETRDALNPTVGATVGDIYQKDSLQPAATVAATLPLDITGLLHAATSQAEFQEVAARLDVNRTQNEVVGDVKRAFYSVLRAKALVAVATENLQNSLDRLSDANLRYQARAVAYYDVVRAETDVANAKKQVIQARNAVSITTASLNGAMGIDITTPLKIQDTSAVQQPPGVQPPSDVPLIPPTDLTIPGKPDQPVTLPPAAEIPAQELTAPKSQQVIDDALSLGPEFQPLLKEGLVTRPEILQADANIAAAKRGFTLAKRSVQPQLSFSMGYFDLRNSTGTTRINEPQARLGLILPLYDGGVVRAREQQARGDISTAITNKRNVIDAVTSQVEQAYLNQIQARDQVIVANQALSQARASFQLARTRYNAGVSIKTGISPLLEVSDAQAALTLAESNQVNALYDYNQSRVVLDAALGRYAFLVSGPGYKAVPSAKTVGRNLK